MGCCFSSTTTTTDDATVTSKTNQKKQNPPEPNHSPLKPPILESHSTRSPPPEEEEAVIKEVLVLSETPVPQNKQGKTTLASKTQAEVSSPVKKQQEQETSNFSQLSEICSISETISTTTTTTATTTTPKGLKEDEATSKEESEINHKSPAKVIKKRPSNGEAGSVRSRRVDPSSEKRARGRGRGLGEVRTAHRNVGSRSRSPGTGRSGGVGRGAVGKSPTTMAGKTDSTPIGSATVEAQPTKEEDGNGDVLEQEQEQEQGTESLENPLVSLECFIFL